MKRSCVLLIALFLIANLWGGSALAETFDNADSFSEGKAPVLVDGQWRYMDSTGALGDPLPYDYIGQFDEGMAPVEKDGLFGYVDMDENEVIPCAYESVWNFRDGIAMCSLNGRTMYITKEGVPAFDFTCDEGRPFSEGLAAVREGDLWGYMDVSGNVAIPPQYEDAQPFAEGRARVLVNGKYGFIDAQANFVIPCDYPAASPQFFDGNVVVVREGKLHSMDRDGNVIATFDQGDLAQFSEGRALVRATGSNKFGFIDETGALIIEPAYDSAYSFSEGRAAVLIGSQWGFIDADGAQVIPCQYDEVNNFSEGWACVCLDGKWRFIDVNGVEMTPAQAENAQLSTGLLAPPAPLATPVPLETPSATLAAISGLSSTPAPFQPSSTLAPVQPSSTLPPVQQQPSQGTAGGKVVTTGQVNMRKGPGKDYKVIIAVPERANCTYLGETSRDERGIDWYKVSYNGKQGWVSSMYANLTSSSPQLPEGSSGQSSSKSVLISGDVHMRSGPGKGYASLAVISQGTRVSYLDKSSTDERGVTWYYVEYKGTKGWVSSKFASLK